MKGFHFCLIIDAIIFASILSSGASMRFINSPVSLAVQSSFFIQVVLFFITEFAQEIIFFVLL